MWKILTMKVKKHDNNFSCKSLKRFGSSLFMYIGMLYACQTLRQYNSLRQAFYVWFSFHNFNPTVTKSLTPHASPYNTIFNIISVLFSYLFTHIYTRNILRIIKIIKKNHSHTPFVFYPFIPTKKNPKK